MKIKFLGTAAAEGMPGTFCECDVCVQSRKEGGKNIRTRSQAIIDDKLLIDFPADTYYHSILYNVELSKIRTCLITHSHSDHLYTSELWCRCGGIGHMENPGTLTMYSARSGYRKITDAVLEFGLDSSKRVVPKLIEPFVKFEAEGYDITPLKANHDQTSNPVIYLIQKDGKSMLYGHDTGYFPEETVEYLKNSGVKLDCVSFDCCGGLYADDGINEWGHMNLNGNIVMRDLLTKNGNITDKTICVVNHFSHNGTPVHEDMAAAAEKAGFYTSYDGYELEF